MPNFIKNITDPNIMRPGLLVTLGGMLGVFIVLILFYLIIKLLIRLFPYKSEV
jgi:hypothetical protein